MSFSLSLWFHTAVSKESIAALFYWCSGIWQTPVRVNFDFRVWMCRLGIYRLTAKPQSRCVVTHGQLDGNGNYEVVLWVSGLPFTQKYNIKCKKQVGENRFWMCVWGGGGCCFILYSVYEDADTKFRSYCTFVTSYLINDKQCRLINYSNKWNGFDFEPFVTQTFGRKRPERVLWSQESGLFVVRHNRFYCFIQYNVKISISSKS